MKKKYYNNVSSDTYLYSHSFALQIAVLVEGLMFACAVTGTESSLIMNGKKIAQNLWSMIKI